VICRDPSRFPTTRPTSRAGIRRRSAACSSGSRRVAEIRLEVHADRWDARREADVGLFPYLAIRYHADDVPTTVIDGRKAIVGSVPESEYVATIVAAAAA
jgi:hypothetical protein